MQRIAHRLIAKTEVFDSYKDKNRKKHVPIKVHFAGAGMIQPPDAKMIREAQEEMRVNRHKKENGAAPNGAVPYPTHQLSLAIYS